MAWIHECKYYVQQLATDVDWNWTRTIYSEHTRTYGWCKITKNGTIEISMILTCNCSLLIRFWLFGSRFGHRIRSRSSTRLSERISSKIYTTSIVCLLHTRMTQPEWSPPIKMKYAIKMEKQFFFLFLSKSVYTNAQMRSRIVGCAACVCAFLCVAWKVERICAPRNENSPTIS